MCKIGVVSVDKYVVQTCHKQPQRMAKVKGGEMKHSLKKELVNAVWLRSCQPGVNFIEAIPVRKLKVGEEELVYGDLEKEVWWFRCSGCVGNCERQVPSNWMELEPGKTKMSEMKKISIKEHNDKGDKKTEQFMKDVNFTLFIPLVNHLSVECCKEYAANPAEGTLISSVRECTAGQRVLLFGNPETRTPFHIRCPGCAGRCAYNVPKNWEELALRRVARFVRGGGQVEEGMNLKEAAKDTVKYTSDLGKANVVVFSSCTPNLGKPSAAKWVRKQPSGTVVPVIFGTPKRRVPWSMPCAGCDGVCTFKIPENWEEIATERLKKRMRRREKVLAGSRAACKSSK